MRRSDRLAGKRAPAPLELVPKRRRLAQPPSASSLLSTDLWSRVLQHVPSESYGACACACTQFAAIVRAPWFNVAYAPDRARIGLFFTVDSPLEASQHLLQRLRVAGARRVIFADADERESEVRFTTLEYDVHVYFVRRMMRRGGKRDVAGINGRVDYYERRDALTHSFSRTTYVRRHMDDERWTRKHAPFRRWLVECALMREHTQVFIALDRACRVMRAYGALRTLPTWHRARPAPRKSWRRARRANAVNS